MLKTPRPRSRSTTALDVAVEIDPVWHHPAQLEEEGERIDKDVTILKNKLNILDKKKLV